MSLKKNAKDRIQIHMLELISRKKPDVIKETTNTFGISNTTAYRYLDELQKSKKIRKDRDGKYILIPSSHTFEYSTAQYLEEDIIYHRDIFPFFVDLPDNVQKIWAYAFMEMMNNAIEHSGAEKIVCYIKKNALNCQILICDDGIGIFTKIQNFVNSNSGKSITVDDAIAELFSGKFTTDRQNHTGEGIFFTSRTLDGFAIYSSNKLFYHDGYNNNTVKNIEIEAVKKLQSALSDNEGTTVFLELSNNSHRDLKEVFAIFSDADKGFFKTHIPIRYAVANGYPVSRSQARRLFSRFPQFEEIELDFNGVEDIGQSFAHELFVVFKRNHPNIKIQVINANDSVTNMIKRVEVNEMTDKKDID